MGLTGLTCNVSTWGGGPPLAVATLMAAPTTGRLASLVCGFPRGSNSKSTLNGEPYWSFQRPLLGHKWFIASENVYKIIAISTKGQIQDDLAATWAFFFPHRGKRQLVYPESGQAMQNTLGLVQLASLPPCFENTFVFLNLWSRAVWVVLSVED